MWLCMQDVYRMETTVVVGGPLSDAPAEHVHASVRTQEVIPSLSSVSVPAPPATRVRVAWPFLLHGASSWKVKMWTTQNH